MGDDEVGLQLFRKDRIPAIAWALCALLLVLSFGVGWYSVHVEVLRWGYDETQFENKGDPLTKSSFHFEMRMFSIGLKTTPLLLEQQIADRGKPTYEEHAGRIGTVMLGVFLLQVVAVLVFAAAVGFYNLRKQRDRSLVQRRLTVIFLLLGPFTLAYFAVAIGGAAQDDTDYLLTQYRFNEQVAYDIRDLEVGFWKTSTHGPETVVVDGDRQVWEAVATSRPSAGWWLHLGAIATFAVGAVALHRTGADGNATREAKLPLDA